jgi:predicted RecA/RadA family phage recombinase
MQGYKHPGEVLEVVAPYALDSGEGCKVGAIFGVATADALISADVRIQVEGVFELVKVGSQAWAKGDKIYWDDGNNRCTTDSAAGMLIGVATEVVASGAGDTTGTVKLCDTSDMSEGAQAAIVTLTDSTGASGSHDDTLADGLNSSAPAAYSAHAAGGVTVTSNAATDLDTTAAALAALRGTVATMQSDAVIMNQNTSDLAQKVIEILARLVAAGIIDA